MKNRWDPLIERPLRTAQERRRTWVILGAVALVALGLAAATARQDPRPVLSHITYELPVEVQLTDETPIKTEPTPEATPEATPSP